jgi:hypothetical protein
MYKMASPLLYREPHVKNLDHLLEGYDYDPPKDEEGLEKRPSKKHWLAQVEAIHLPVSDWVVTRGPNILSILPINDFQEHKTPTTIPHPKNEKALAIVFPALKRFIHTKLPFYLGDRNHGTRPYWPILTMPFASTCATGDMTPTWNFGDCLRQPENNRIQTYSRHCPPGSSPGFPVAYTTSFIFGGERDILQIIYSKPLISLDFDTYQDLPVNQPDDFEDQPTVFGQIGLEKYLACRPLTRFSDLMGELYGAVDHPEGIDGEDSEEILELYRHLNKHRLERAYKDPIAVTFFPKNKAPACEACGRRT